MKISEYRRVKNRIAKLEKEIAELKETMEGLGMSVTGYQGVCLGGGTENSEPDYMGEYHMINVFLRTAKAELRRLRFNPLSRIPKYNGSDYDFD